MRKLLPLACLVMMLTVFFAMAHTALSSQKRPIDTCAQLQYHCQRNGKLVHAPLYCADLDPPGYDHMLIDCTTSALLAYVRLTNPPVDGTEMQVTSDDCRVCPLPGGNEVIPYPSWAPLPCGTSTPTPTTLPSATPSSTPSSAPASPTSTAIPPTPSSFSHASKRRVFIRLSLMRWRP